MLVIGSNTTEAHPVLALRIKKAVRKGATLVVADPRKIWLTKLAKRHLQLRPGTDVWLINAMMHTILEEGLQNEEYIREHTEGFEAVRDVVARYTPEEAEAVTGIPADRCSVSRAGSSARRSRQPRTVVTRAGAAAAGSCRVPGIPTPLAGTAPHWVKRGI